ncbi:MAG: hypothetical protein ACI97A_003704 [Planctomycetota bacterium]|jgi:hypothetical protein
MKTKSPDAFGCQTYLKSWELGFRSGSTLEHTLNCAFCRPVIHGGTEDCRLPVTEEVKKTRQKKRSSRRRFLAAAAFSTVALLGTSTAVQSFFSPPAASPLVLAIRTQGTRFDTVYMNSGGPGIHYLLRSSNDQTKKNILEWIYRRQHWSLLDMVISSLDDKSEAVRLKAIILLVDHTPKIELKPHLSQIDRSRSRATDDLVRSYLVELVREVEQS